MLLPLALGWSWLLALLVVLVLAWTRSVTAWLASLVGLAVLYPRAVWMLGPGAALALWVRHRFPPGAILDTLRARLLTWGYLLGDLRRRGHGPGSVRLACEAAHLRSAGRAMDGGPARNEFLEIAYMYGLGGGVGIGIGLALLAVVFRWGDPWSASAVAGLVVCGSTSPLVALRRWLAGGDGPLFGPPLRASLTIHIDHTGAAHLYGIKPENMTPELAQDIAQALGSITAVWAEVHGLVVTLGDAR